MATDMATSKGDVASPNVDVYATSGVDSEGASATARVVTGSLVLILGVVAGLMTYATFGSSWFTFVTGGSLLFFAIAIAGAISFW